MYTGKYIIIDAESLNEIAQMTATTVVAMLKDSALLSSIINARAEEDELVDSKEACRILACCERTLQRYRASRLVTVIYRGPHRCYYFRDELLSLRDANTRPNRDSK